jgi:hypothetical protein
MRDNHTGRRGGCTMLIFPTMMLIALCLVLSGCGTLAPASVAGGECKIFRDPGFAVRGRRLRDSQWIGRTQETGINVCHWRRPQQ